MQQPSTWRGVHDHTCEVRTVRVASVSVTATTNWEAYHTPETLRREYGPAPAIDRKPLLDKPSEDHPILTALMNEALTRILLVSDGGTAALKERITHSHATTRAPSSDLAVTLESLSVRFVRCKTHRRRLQIIRDAQRLATLLRYAPDRSAVHGTDEWRSTVANDDRSCRVLAEVYGVSRETVRRIKRDAGTLGQHGGARHTG